MHTQLTTSEQEEMIIEQWAIGLISKEERDKLLNDITPILWEESHETAKSDYLILGV